ncbi:g13419 [Coccomyxa viridis]|uniref:Inositol oxygenase n=1 Tax=Coccomyxa viridis TaxID=1274662 RepID=A0ABP1GCQ2_9CHLO
MKKCLSANCLLSLQPQREHRKRDHTDAALSGGTADVRGAPINAVEDAYDVPSGGQPGKGGSLGPWAVKPPAAPRRKAGPAPEVDAELWRLHNLWRERQQSKDEGHEPCRDSASSFDRIRLSSHSDLAKKDSESSSLSDGSNCSLSSLTGARQVAFIRRSRDTPFRAVSLPEALADSDEGYSCKSSRGSQGAQFTRAHSQRSSLDSDDCSEMDADCCGDSGAISFRGRRSDSRRSESASSESLHSDSSGRLSHGSAARANSLSTLSASRCHLSSDEESDMASPGTPRVLSRWHSSVYVSEGQAAVELFFRLNHARQTMDYVRHQAATYAKLERRVMSVWEGLGMLGTLREYETALLQEENTDADMPLVQHAMQTAENCRAAFPDLDWLHLVGLIHSLGKVLAHKQMGAEPQWAVSGESFPVGCRFHPAIACSQFFSVNPDRRRRIYSTPTGVYKPNCGLAAVLMSWSASEYLYMVLILNRTRLPPEALFLIRHQRFFALNRPGEPYSELLSESDRLMVPWLSRFRELSAYKRSDDAPQERLTGQAFRNHYSGLIRKYIPGGTLRW